MNERKRAAIYARVAADDLNGSGLSTQVEACRQYADQHGFTVTEDHIVAEVYSGITLRRPGLDRVRALVTGQEVDVVIVSAPDRLSRNALYLPSLYEEWQWSRVKVHYLGR